MDHPPLQEQRPGLGAEAGAAPADLADGYLEIYKLAVEMADRVSARRGVANSYFLTLNTAVLAVIGTVAVRWYLAAAGIVLCVAWWALMKNYRDLNRAKFAVILAMEEQLPARVYGDEWQRLRVEPVSLRLAPGGGPVLVRPVPGTRLHRADRALGFRPDLLCRDRGAGRGRPTSTSWPRKSSADPAGSASRPGHQGPVPPVRPACPGQRQGRSRRRMSTTPGQPGCRTRRRTILPSGPSVNWTPERRRPTSRSPRPSGKSPHAPLNPGMSS